MGSRTARPGQQDRVRLTCLKQMSDPDTGRGFSSNVGSGDAKTKNASGTFRWHC
jgi:hypothetical protein